jgi:hypothetical protein
MLLSEFWGTITERLDVFVDGNDVGLYLWDGILVGLLYYEGTAGLGKHFTRTVKVAGIT